MGPLSWHIERRQLSTRKGEKEDKSTGRAWLETKTWRLMRPAMYIFSIPWDGVFEELASP